MLAHHAHPIMVVEHLWRFLYLLILPLLRGVFAALQNGWRGWLSGAWFDLLVLCAILALALMRWYFLTYECHDDTLYIFSGFFCRVRTLVPQTHVDTLAITRPFYLRPFHAVRLRADTKAGSFKKADVCLTLHERAAELIFSEREAFFSNPNYFGREYRPGGMQIAALSAILSNSLAGVLFFSAFISQTGNLLGEEMEARIFGTFERFTRMMAFGIPPAAAALAYLLFFGWLFTFVRNLTRHHNFCARRSCATLDIFGGLFTTRSYSICVAAINYVDIRQSVLTRILGISSVFVHAVGYGKEQDDVSALIPAARQNDLASHLGLLLPEFRPARRQLKPNFGALFRFVNDALWPCLLLPLATLLLRFFLPDWRDFIVWVGFMASLPAFLFLLVRLCDFATSGLANKNGSYTLRYSSGFYLHTVVLPHDKVATIALRQSVFQKFDNKCDLFIRSVGESPKNHHIRNLDKADVCRILGLAP